MHNPIRSLRRYSAPCALLALVCLLLTPAAIAEVTETVSHTFDLGSGDLIKIRNLAGSVRVDGGSASATLEATIHAESQEILDLLDLEIDKGDQGVEVLARYPVDHHDKYHYPAMKGTSRTSTRYQGEKVTVSGRTSGAITLWVDFVLHLPRGVGFEVENAAGNVAVDAILGPMMVDTGSGHVEIANGGGNAGIDTGSGNVEISNHRGNIDADTGSGNIRIRDAVGTIVADTGSGNVVLDDVKGGNIYADTGSGNIELQNVRGEIRADTGSGSISGRDLVATGRLEADTGSGGVRLEGDFSGTSAIDIDTGSGDVELRGSFPGLDLEIETSSGGIDVDLPDLEIETKNREELEGTTGDGGVRLHVDTGSGRVTIAGR